MIPFPFFYSETYIPSLGGVPSYVYGWLINAAVVFGLIGVYYKMCMKRKEYHVYDEENKDDKKEVTEIMGAAVQPSPGPFYTVLIIYLGVMAFIGWYASRKTSSLGRLFRPQRKSRSNR